MYIGPKNAIDDDGNDDDDDDGGGGGDGQVKAGIEAAKKMIDQGGDWDRRNRLKVLHCAVRTRRCGSVSVALPKTCSRRVPRVSPDLTFLIFCFLQKSRSTEKRNFCLVRVRA